MSRTQCKTLHKNGTCPKCNADWDAGNVYETLRKHDAYASKTDDELREVASHYGKPDARFSRLVGIQVRGVYDGVLYWECPDCHQRWNRSEIGD